MNVKHLKFKVQGAEDVQEHVFQLGLGPCGKWVSALLVDINLAVMTVKQVAYDEDFVTAHQRASNEGAALLAEWQTVWATPDQADGRVGAKCVGWDNLQYMTPTEAAWRKAQEANANELCRLRHLEPEIKVFVYRLEDIRGRITALQQEEECYQRKSGYGMRRS